MDMSEIKILVEKQGTAFEQFKQANDERLKALATGKSVADLEVTLAAINKDLDKHGADLKAIATRAAAAQLEDDGLDRNGKRKATPEEREYKKALNAYYRKGETHDLGSLGKKAMSVDSDPNGGYWVEPDTSGRMVNIIFESSPIRQIADVMTISTDALEGPEDRGEVDGSWVGERGTRNVTNTPEVGEWRIPVHEMYAQPKATQKLLDDSAIDVEAWLSQKVGDKFARMENTAFVTGNGVGKPRGFMDYTAVATVDATRAWGQLEYVPTGTSAGFGATTNGTDKLTDLVYAMKAPYRQNANFVMARLTLGAVRKLKDGMGNYIWQPAIQAGQPSMLLNHPVVEAADMPAIAADAYAIAFGNFKLGYQIVDRQGIRVLRDPFTAKPYVLFYTTKRTGGAVLNFECIKLLKFGTT